MQQQLGGGAPGTPSARVAAPTPTLYGRARLSPHFVFHYTLAPGYHRVKRLPEDSTLNRLVDSILTSLPVSLPTGRRDSTLHAALDSMGAPLPAYVRQAEFYAERAYAYYVDTLRMSAPQSSGVSAAFRGPSSPGRFPVDIADIGKADPFYDGEYYALTYPPPISILLENDFLWGVSLDAGGNAVGLPVHAVVNGQTLHDYSVEWDLGLKVTLTHEFYHAIQFTYTPGIAGGYHAWYELSAVGMEERLAPEVNDYFQYLPFVLLHHQTVSLLTPPPNSENYGNSLFHQFLTSALGRAFDTTTWAALRTNGNNLSQALLTMVQAHGKSWDSLYDDYAAALAAAGRPFSGTVSCTDTAAPIFSRDLPCWPSPQFDSIISPQSTTTFAVPALTFRLLRPPPSAGPAWVELSGLGTAQRVESLAPGGTQAFPISGANFPLAAETGINVLFLSLPNPSFTQAGQARIIPESDRFAAFPNPTPLSSGMRVIFSAPGAAAGQALTLVAESGRRVAAIALNPADGFWTWDLRDVQRRLVPPGVYYYRSPGNAARTLVVLPP